MAGIFIDCPTTGAKVPTGQHASLMFMDATIASRGQFRCSACNQIHAWSAEVAIIGETKAHLRQDGNVSLTRV